MISIEYLQIAQNAARSSSRCQSSPISTPVELCRKTWKETASPQLVLGVKREQMKPFSPWTESHDLPLAAAAAPFWLPPFKFWILFFFISDLSFPPSPLVSSLIPDSLAANSDSDSHPTGCSLPMPPGTLVPDAYSGLSNVPGLMMHNQENIFTAALRKFPSWFETLLAWIDFHNCGGKPKMYKGSLFSEFTSLNFSEWMWVCWKLSFLRTA